MVHFNADGVADKRQVAENTSEFIRQRLELITQELDSVEGGIADFKSENRFMDVGSTASDSICQNLQWPKQQIFSFETQLMVLEGIEEYTAFCQTLSTYYPKEWGLNKEEWVVQLENTMNSYFKEMLI